MARKKSIPQGVYQAHIHNMSHEGRGIADIEGKKVFIDNALIGETVEFEYRYIKRRLSQGLALNIQAPSSVRVAPKCAFFGQCGGCSLQHMEHQAAIEFKQKMVLEQIQHFSHTQPQTILPALTGPQWGYRYKARLGVRDVAKKGGILVGFREKFSNRITVMDRCEVLHPSIGHILAPLQTVLESLTIKAHIPQIEVAVGDDKRAIVVRHLEPLEGQDLIALSAFCKEYDLSLYGQAKGYDSVVKLYPHDEDFFLHYELPEQKLRFAFHPSDFTQVNPMMNQAMVSAALEQLDIQPGERILDLFCGIGNFTLPLAQRSEHVVGVEGSDTAILRAQNNQRLNNINHIQFYVEDLFKPPFAQAWAQQTYDKILLDPPRSGAQAVIPWIAAQPHLSKVVYVSCNPATLARDIGLLAAEGFILKSLRIMDMFPHTAHVESMVSFERG